MQSDQSSPVVLILLSLVFFLFCTIVPIAAGGGVVCVNLGGRGREGWFIFFCLIEPNSSVSCNSCNQFFWLQKVLPNKCTYLDLYF